MENKFKKIGFAGLDHLGLSSIVTTADKGFTVIGYHHNAMKISELKKGKISIKEPRLKKLLLKNRKKISFSSNSKSLSECKIVYISLDVYTDASGKSDLNPVKKIIKDVTKVLNKNTILIILSQVPPGFTRKIKWNKKKLFYQVETLIFGNAINRALYPDRLIIGCSNFPSLIDNKLKIFLRKFNCPILCMRYESAEFAKISINTCLSSSITTTNILAELCEKIGADWSEIIPALKMDKRIGQHAYIKPGLGISGGNLERDLNNVVDIAEKYKINNRSIKAMILNSQYSKNWAWRQLKELVLKNKKKPKICLLGLSYKENTSSIKNAPSINLLEKLKKYNVSVFDPAVPIDAINYPVNIAKSSIEAIRKADVLLIMSPWKEFCYLKIKILNKIMRGKVIIDPYRMLNEHELNKYGFIYSTIGKSRKIK